MLYEVITKYRRMEEEVRFEPYQMDGAGIVIIAFGTAARVSKTAIQWSRKEGRNNFV